MLSDDEIWARWKFPADWSWKQSVINLARAIEREARQQTLEEASGAVHALLDEVERLRAFERDVIEAIPGPRYMDPPDGGDVTPLEQVRRMATEVEQLRGALTAANAQAEHFEREGYLRGDEVERLRRDATRYRWLRGDSCMDHSARWTQWEVRRWKAPLWTGDLRRADLDAAIDDAMRKEPDHAR